MFKSTFRKSSTQSGNRDPRVLPVLTADALLNEQKRQTIISKLQALLSLSDSDYRKYAKPVIDNFAEFVQQLPETRHSYFSHRGGLLDHALDRTLTALTMARTYFLPDGSESSPLTQPQTLWAYAVFSASMLHDLGKIPLEMKIELCDKNGKSQKVWQPFSGSMVNQGQFYYYEFQTRRDETLRKRLSTLLARQLMPEVGFLWIASVAEVLTVWLALMEDDTRSGRMFGHSLVRAEGEAIRAYLEKLQLRMQMEHTGKTDAQKLSQLSTTFTAPQKGGGEGGDNKPVVGGVGLDFIAWVRDSIGNGKINLNSSGVFVTAEGVFLTTEIFAKFAAEHPEIQSAQMVQESFSKLGLHQLGTGNLGTQMFLSLGNNLRLQGFLLTKFDLAIPSTLTTKVLQNSSKYQSDLVKLPPKQSAQTQHFVATNGNLVNQAPELNNPIQPKPPQGF